MTATNFLNSSGLATLWSRICSLFLSKTDAASTYVKKEDVATINGASLINGGNITSDSTVTQGSTNSVTGGAVYNYCHGVVDNFDGGFYVS